MRTIAVTGGSGKLGSQVVKALLQQGDSVVSLDNRTLSGLGCRQIKVDLNNFGEVVEALHGADAIIHLAAIPAPHSYPNTTIFTNNVVSTYHILEAASILGINKVVLGSSESSYGFAWAPEPFAPDYVPVDEEHPQLPQECYGLSKIVNEVTAAMFDRRNGMQIVSLRFSMIVGENEYAHLDPLSPKKYTRNLWSYVDIRDAVSACLASLAVNDRGAICLNITSDDTLSDQDTIQLLDEFYPEVTDRRGGLTGRQALVSNEQAKQVLNWTPQYSWKTER